jgi:hypothetical protein
MPKNSRAPELEAATNTDLFRKPIRIRVECKFRSFCFLTLNKAHGLVAKMPRDVGSDEAVVEALAWVLKVALGYALLRYGQ